MATAVKKKPAKKKPAANKLAKTGASKVAKKTQSKSLDELKAAHYEKIKAVNKRVNEAQIQMDADSRVAKGSKKAYESLAAELISLINSDPAQRTLFPEPTAGAPGEAKPLPDGERRKVNVRELGITPGVADKLASADINTLGDLDAFWKSRKVLTDIKGIGEGTAGIIADQYADYGRKHPELFGESTSESNEAPADQTDDSLKEEIAESLDKRGSLAK